MTIRTDTVLHRYHREAVTLGAVLDEICGAGWVGLVYTPNWAGLSRWDDGQLQSPEETVVLEQVFEARLFCEIQELRWLRHPAGMGEGDAVVLAESPLSLQQEWARAVMQNLEPLDGQYLIAGWGCSIEGLPDGWSGVANASIGTRCIPLADLEAGASAVLRYREYLGQAEENLPRADGDKTRDGNCIVREERLLKIAPAPAQRSGEKETRETP